MQNSTLKKDFIKFLDKYVDTYCDTCADTMIKIMKSVKNKKTINIVFRPDPDYNSIHISEK